MAKQLVNIGSSANDGTGDPLRTAFDKINGNFNELYASGVQGVQGIQGIQGTTGSGSAAYKIGDVFITANTAPSSGTWLVSNGQLVLKETYSALNELIGSDYSPLILNWTETVTNIPNDSSIWYTEIAYNGTVFIAEGSSNNYYRSTDGVTWTSRQLPNTIQITTSGKSQFQTYANNKFLVSCETTQSNVFSYYTSTDGLTWNESIIYLPDAHTQTNFVEYGNNTWISIASLSEGNVISVVSTDNGITWNQYDTLIPIGNPQRFPYPAKYGNGKWMMALDNSTNSWTDIALSNDGITWNLTANAMPKFNTDSGAPIYSWGKNKWLAIIKDNSNLPRTYESSNSVTWTLTNTLYPNFSYGDGVFSDYALNYSPSLEGWIYDVEFLNDPTYLTRTYFTPDGRSWIDVDQPQDATVNSVYSEGKTISFGNTMYQIVPTNYNPSNNVMVLRGTLSYNISTHFVVTDLNLVSSPFITYIKAL